MPIITFQGKTKHLLNRCLLLGLYRKCNLRSVFQQRFSVSIYVRSTWPWLGMMMIRMSDDDDEKPDMWPWLGTHTEARRCPKGSSVGLQSLLINMIRKMIIIIIIMMTIIIIIMMMIIIVINCFSPMGGWDSSDHHYVQDVLDVYHVQDHCGVDHQNMDNFLCSSLLCRHQFGVIIN